jgi:coproporphyrinogen III oxidase-like Fe-S oxidoreductase
MTAEEKHGWTLDGPALSHRARAFQAFRKPAWRASVTYEGDECGFGIYVHWPFCAAKCPYCDFNSHVAMRPSTSRASRAPSSGN